MGYGTLPSTCCTPTTDARTIGRAMTGGTMSASASARPRATTSTRTAISAANDRLTPRRSSAAASGRSRAQKSTATAAGSSTAISCRAIHHAATAAAAMPSSDQAAPPAAARRPSARVGRPRGTGDAHLHPQALLDPAAHPGRLASAKPNGPKIDGGPTKARQSLRFSERRPWPLPTCDAMVMVAPWPSMVMAAVCPAPRRSAGRGYVQCRARNPIAPPPPRREPSASEVGGVDQVPSERERERIGLRAHPLAVQP